MCHIWQYTPVVALLHFPDPARSSFFSPPFSSPAFSTPHAPRQAPRGYGLMRGCPLPNRGDLGWGIAPEIFFL